MVRAIQFQCAGHERERLGRAVVTDEQPHEVHAPVGPLPRHDPAVRMALLKLVERSHRWPPFSLCRLHAVQLDVDHAARPVRTGERSP